MGSHISQSVVAKEHLLEVSDAAKFKSLQYVNARNVQNAYKSSEKANEWTLPYDVIGGGKSVLPNLNPEKLKNVVYHIHDSKDHPIDNINDLRQKPMSERGERTEKSIPADLEYLRKAVYSKSPFDTNESILSPQID